jgi:hypothetical protein
MVIEILILRFVLNWKLNWKVLRVTEDLKLPADVNQVLFLRI